MMNKKKLGKYIKAHKDEVLMAAYGLNPNINSYQGFLISKSTGRK